MGKKEKQKKLIAQKAVAQVSKSEDLKRYVVSEIMKVRSELSAKSQKLNETMVRFVQEMSKMRTELTILSKALRDTKVIANEDLDNAFKALQNDTLKMFNDDGQMKGSPIITCYNTSFEIETPGYEVKRVYTV